MADKKRLIDANALKEDYVVLVDKYIGKCRCVMLYQISNAPTVDAVEVVHGRWIDAREFCGDYMCSNCDALYGTNMFHYCPNCGAKMDGDGNG